MIQLFLQLLKINPWQNPIRCRIAGSQVMVWLGFQCGNVSLKEPHSSGLQAPVSINKHTEDPNTVWALGGGNRPMLGIIGPYNFFTKAIEGRVLHGCFLRSANSQPPNIFLRLMDSLVPPPGSASSSPLNRMKRIMITVKHSHRKRRQAANSKTLWTTLSNIKNSQGGGEVLKRRTRGKYRKIDWCEKVLPPPPTPPKKACHVIPLPRISLDHEYSPSIITNWH